MVVQFFHTELAVVRFHVPAHFNSHGVSVTVRQMKKWLDTIPKEYEDFTFEVLAYGTVESINGFKLDEIAIYLEEQAVVFPVLTQYVKSYHPTNEEQLNTNKDPSLN